MEKPHLWLLGLVILGIFQACKNIDSNPFKLTDENAITVQDQKGEIWVPREPKRVILLDRGALDIFDELGIADKIVGFPKTHLPKYLEKLQNNEEITDLGSWEEPDLQKIKALDPDLIIMGEDQLKDHKAFNKIAPTLVYQVDCADVVGSIRSNLFQIGKIFELEKEAKAIDEDMRLSIRLNRAAEKSRKGLVVLFQDGEFTAYGKDSCFGNIVYHELNIPSLPENPDFPLNGQIISSEYIREINPDLLFVIDKNAALGEGRIQTTLIENPSIRETKAYKNHKIIYLSPEVWYWARGGVHAMKIMAEEIGTGR